MIIDEYELYALACDADKRDIPEAAAAVFRTLLRRHPESPLAGAATFYLQNGFQLPSAIDSESRPRPARPKVNAGKIETLRSPKGDS